MSTRSNIFVDFNGERKQFYHHCDGYLDGVGKDLLVRMEMAIERARNDISYLVSTERVYKEFINLLEEEGSYKPEEIGLHRDIEYLYYVEFSPKGNRVTYTKTQWHDNKKYYQNLETAKCGDYTLSLVLHTEKKK